MFNLATGEHPAPEPVTATAGDRRVRHRPDTVRIRVERLLFPPAVSAGMNPYVLMSLTYSMKGTTGDPKPIEVTVVSAGLYRIRDGRHRTVAAIMAGRSDVLAKIVELT